MVRQLPVGAAFGHTVKSTLNNLPFAFHISWPWMLLLLPISIAGNIYLTMNPVPIPIPNPAKAYENLEPDRLAVVVGMGALAIIAFASIAVSWHRYILLDEIPRGLARLRLDSTVWRYVGNAIGIALLSGLASVGILIIPSFIAGFSLSLGMGGWVIAGPVVLAGLVYTFGVSMRLSIKLPAIAMHNTGVDLGKSWQLTRNNHWRVGILFTLVVICLLGVGFAFSLVASVLSASSSTISLVTLVIAQMAVNWASTIWNVTLLTSLYGFFVERRDF